MVWSHWYKHYMVWRGMVLYDMVWCGPPWYGAPGETITSHYGSQSESHSYGNRTHLIELQQSVI